MLLSRNEAIDRAEICVFKTNLRETASEMKR